MIAVTVRRIPTLLALIVPAAGRAAGPEVGPATVVASAPHALPMRHENECEGAAGPTS